MNNRGNRKPRRTRVAFGDVARQVKDHVDPVTANLQRFVAGEHMDTDELRIRRWGNVGDGYLGPAFHARFRPGHVLYGSRRTYLRKVAFADFEGVTANTTFVIETRDPSVLLPELLPFIMQTESFHEYSIKKSKGSVNPYVNFSDIAAYEFTLPLLDEQRRLARLLMRIEAAARTLQDAHAALTTLRKSALMHRFGQLLADPDVRRVPVGEVGEVLLGRQRAPQHEDGPSMRPYLRAANVFDGYIDTADVKSMNFSPSEYQRYRLHEGDVLLNEGQSRELVGRSAIFRGEVPDTCFQNTLVRFRPGPLILGPYAHRYFQHCMYAGTFAAVAKQTTSIAHLGAKSLADLPIPLLGKSRQLELTKQLSAIDAALPGTRGRAKRLKTLKARISEPIGASLQTPEGGR